MIIQGGCKVTAIGKLMDKSTMRFLFGDRELVLTVGALLSARTDTIILPAETDLSQQPGIAWDLIEQAGDQVRQESIQLIREYGAIDQGMAVFTSGGELPYRAIIHAVVPVAGAEDPGHLLERALSRSLQICDMNEWQSLACPVMDLSAAGLHLGDIAEAYFRVITHFWDARQECALEKVVIYASEQQFRPFFDAFREHGLSGEDADTPVALPANGAQEEQIGEIELSEDDIASLDNSDIDSWFK